MFCFCSFLSIFLPLSLSLWYWTRRRSWLTLATIPTLEKKIKHLFFHHSEISVSVLNFSIFVCYMCFFFVLCCADCVSPLKRSFFITACCIRILYKSNMCTVHVLNAPPVEQQQQNKKSPKQLWILLFVFSLSVCDRGAHPLCALTVDLVCRVGAQTIGAREKWKQKNGGNGATEWMRGKIYPTTTTTLVCGVWKINENLWLGVCIVVQQ